MIRLSPPPTDPASGRSRPSNGAEDAARQEARDWERARVERLRQGDTAAFTDVMEAYVPRLIQFARHIVGAHDVAEDVVQNVFIGVWEHRAALDAERPLKPYLYTAVRNRALKEVRATMVRDQYRTSVQNASTNGERVPGVPSPEGAILTATTIEAALAQLSESRRIALRLRLEEEMSHAEIAEVLGVSPMAAQRTVARAIADLRAILGNM